MPVKKISKKEVQVIEATCEKCGQKSLKPDPPESVRTPYERIDFEKVWDQQVLAGQEKQKEST